MSILGKILAAPARLVGTAAAVVNAVTEKVLGDDVDFLDIEGNAKELAEDIEEAVDR